MTNTDTRVREWTVYGAALVLDEHGEIMARCHDNTQARSGMDNADLIVRAVNSHADLLAALEAVVSEWDAIALRQNNPGLEAAIEAGREVIRRAKGEE